MIADLPWGLFAMVVIEYVCYCCHSVIHHIAKIPVVIIDGQQASPNKQDMAGLAIVIIPPSSLYHLTSAAYAVNVLLDVLGP